MTDELMLLQLTRFGVGLAGLGLAAYLDIKTRRVPNKVWWVMGVAAGFLWLGDMHLRERPWEHFALLGPLAVFFAFAFIDPSDWPWKARRVGWHGLQAMAVIGLLYLCYRCLLPFDDMDWEFAALLAVPILMGLMVGAYYAGLMLGGADVKALMTVALLAPTYPDIVPWDLMVASDLLAVPMPFVIFGNSLLCYLAIPIILVVWNLAHRSSGPLIPMLFGYRMPIEKARKKFVWPMERVVKPRSATPGEEKEEKEDIEEDGTMADEGGDNEDSERDEIEEVGTDEPDEEERSGVIAAEASSEDSEIIAEPDPDMEPGTDPEPGIDPEPGKGLEPGTDLELKLDQGPGTDLECKLDQGPGTDLECKLDQGPGTDLEPEPDLDPEIGSNGELDPEGTNMPADAGDEARKVLDKEAPASAGCDDMSSKSESSSKGEASSSSDPKPRIVFEFFPRNRHDSDQVYDDLEAAGRTQVWVTPKTPYMVPLAAAWVVSFLFGDIFFNWLTF